jgi:MULE transposase domain
MSENYIKVCCSETGNTSHYFIPGENVLYRTRKVAKSGIRYLKCIESNCRCNGKIAANVFSRTNNAIHNHENHKVKAEYEIAYARLRETVRNDRRPVRELHREAQRTLSSDAAGLMEWTHCRKTLQRIRQNQMPPCRDLSEMVDLLETNEGVFESFGKLRDSLFYQGTVNGQLVFANLELVSALGANIEIYVDATFNCLPFRAHQLFIILGKIQDKPRPIVYSIMNGRAEDNYTVILNFVKLAVVSFDGVERTPILATSDFEQAIRSSLRKVWPTIQLVGCNFHYCQCLRRKAASLPELSLKISAIHHKVLVMFMRLSLLPICNVGVGFDGLIGFIEQNNLRDDFGEFIEYFENTWFNRYPVNTWCLSERYRRSNNHLEGYNCQVKRIIPKSLHLGHF